MLRITTLDRRAKRTRNPAHSGKEPNRGFSLIELVTVLAILAILVSLAVPAYLEQMRKSRRADATSSLLSAAHAMERCFTRFNAYNAADCASPAGSSADGFYTITVNRTATTYTLSATPAGDQAKDDCGTFGLDHLGNKTPAPDNHRCWGS